MRQLIYSVWDCSSLNFLKTVLPQEYSLNKLRLGGRGGAGWLYTWFSVNFSNLGAIAVIVSTAQGLILTSVSTVQPLT